jgi:hypothetical protein
MNTPLALVALMLTLTGAPVKQANDHVLDPASLADDLRFADQTAARLRSRVGFHAEPSQARVRAMISVGSGIVHETSLMAFRKPWGAWWVERVDFRDGLREPPIGRIDALSPAAGDELDALLRDPALYREPEHAQCGLFGVQRVVSVRFEGRRRDAVLQGCKGAPIDRVLEILNVRATSGAPGLAGAH